MGWKGGGGGWKQILGSPGTASLIQVYLYVCLRRLSDSAPSSFLFFSFSLFLSFSLNMPYVNGGEWRLVGNNVNNSDLNEVPPTRTTTYDQCSRIYSALSSWESRDASVTFDETSLIVSIMKQLIPFAVYPVIWYNAMIYITKFCANNIATKTRIINIWKGIRTRRVFAL